jgi:thiamine biosynthesis lipoprotein
MATVAGVSGSAAAASWRPVPTGEDAVGVALAAARWTGGLADPTVGGALIGLGYDRDFAAISPEPGGPPAEPVPAPGWYRVRLDGPLLRLPAGIRLDLRWTARAHTAKPIVGANRMITSARNRGRVGGVAERQVRLLLLHREQPQDRV